MSPLGIITQLKQLPAHGQSFFIYYPPPSPCSPPALGYCEANLRTPLYFICKYFGMYL